MTDAVIKKYKDMVYRIALSYTGNPSDADDIFQEVFLRYYRKRPTFSSPNHEKAWFIKVTINCSKTWCSLPWRKKILPITEDLPYEETEASDIKAALMRLPSKYRVVMELHYYEGYSVKEIGDLLGRKETTVKQQLYRGREKLREMLEAGNTSINPKQEGSL